MPDNQTMIILAGGLGARLRPLVSDRPKVLAPVAGRPFIDYLLTYLAEQDIRQVILSVGYLAEQVRAYVADGRRWKMNVEYVEEKLPLGTGGALKLASLAGGDWKENSPFFALNGDTLFQVNLAELWCSHQANQALATIALREIQTSPADASERPDYRLRGCVTVDENRLITSFDEKPTENGIGTAARPILTNGGVYVLTPAALANIEPGQAASLERDVFPALAATRQLAGFPQTGYFVDIGAPHSLNAFEQDILRGMKL